MPIYDEKATKLAFSTFAVLGNGATYDSTVLDLSTYTQVQTHVLSDVDGTIVVDFVRDSGGTDILRTLTIPYVGGSGYQVFAAPAFTPYVRYRFTANEAGQTDFYFDTKFLRTALSPQVLGTEAFISSQMTSTLNRSVLVGKTDGGVYTNVPVSGYGHLEVALHEPRLPFGSIHTEKLTPVFQSDAVYGINSGQVSTVTSLSGTATTADSSFVVTTGTTLYGSGTIQSRKRLRYRAGQGVVGRFTGLFSSPVANSYQVIGFGHPEDGVFFGYNGTTFGILHSSRGIREQQTLTINTASTTVENITITLNSVAFSVPVTDSDDPILTAYEIAKYSYTGWSAQPLGNTVVFVANSVGDKTGTFSLSGASTADGSFAQTVAGVATTDVWIPQTSWNQDTMDGNGPSGITLDPTKGNVFEIGIQYLGYGAITFSIEGSSDSANNATFIPVHQINSPNTRTTTTFGNPSFPFTMSAVSAGSTTDISVKSGSFAGFIEGDIVKHGNRFSYFNSKASTVGPSAYHALLTVYNKYSYNGRSNQAVINLLDVVASVKHTQPVRLYVIRNGTLAGAPNFTSYASNSCSLYDTAATTVTYSSNDQLIWSGGVGETGELDHIFSDDITIQPGEWVTLAMRTLQNTAAWVSCGLNTREDQ